MAAMTAEELEQYTNQVQQEFIAALGKNVEQMRLARPDLILRNAVVVLLGQIAMQLAAVNERPVRIMK